MRHREKGITIGYRRVGENYRREQEREREREEAKRKRERGGGE